MEVLRKPSRNKNLAAGGTFLFGCILGISAAAYPYVLIAGCVGAVALLFLKESRLAGLLLVGAWPAYVLPPRLTAPVTVLLGLALIGHLLLRGLSSSLVRGSQVWGDVALVLAFGVAAVAASLPISSLSATRLILFAFVSLPCFVAGRTMGTHELVRSVTWMGAPLIAWGLLVSGVIGHVNPIAFAQAAVVTALAFFVQASSMAARGAVALAALSLVAGTGKLGPLVAFAAGALYLILASVFGRGTTGTTKKVLVGIPIALIAVAVLVHSYNAARQELLTDDASALSRIAAARFALGNLTIVGDGADSLGSQRLEGRYVVRYTHNFILDALVVAGGVGMIPIVVLLGRAAARTRRRTDRMLAPFVCVLVGSLFSGGVLENWAMWLALGALLVPDRSHAGRPQDVSASVGRPCA